MKTITIKQPWASLICKGIKDVENRTWPTKFRGRILIHAALKDFDFRNSMTSEYQREFIKEIKKPYIKGAIIGSVEIIDCLKSKDSLHKAWGDMYCFHWVLANPILFPEPIPAKGKLSFWDYPGILAEPEEEDGEMFCHCQLPVKEVNQVTGGCGDFRCAYCGGRWYK